MDAVLYFTKLGYKYIVKYHKIIVQDFQRHVFPFDKKQWDGVTGPITQAKIDFYNKDNFCPEVFESIKPYIPYTDEQIESLLQYRLKGLGSVFNHSAKINDFNVLHSISHAVLESSWGNSFIARFKNNIYGWRAYDSSPAHSAIKFINYADCIIKWSYWFNKEYLLQTGKYYHGNSEHGVNIVYATSPTAGINKSFIVRDLRNKLI